MQRTAPPELILSAVNTVGTGDEIEPEELLKRFIDAGYIREEICEGPGQVTLRGGYIDIYPITSRNPYRIEFFGDEVDTIREFDAVSQRSTQNVPFIEVPPAVELPLNSELRGLGLSALKGRPGYAEEYEEYTEQPEEYNGQAEATAVEAAAQEEAPKQEEAPAILAGDIGIITKLSSFKTGDTLCAPKADIKLKGVSFPKPCLPMAVKAKKKGEEDKVAAGLNRLAEEDLTISYYTNTETKEQIVAGLGEQHLDSLVTKLKNKFGVEVELTVPKVAYRETIGKKVAVQGRHKKQSGGSGQFGDVWVEFEPIPTEDFEFAERVVGGSVPKNFFPAVEKGLQEAILKGPLAGYPVVGLKAVLYDGSYHPVDSNEMAFKTAAKIAYKNGMAQANPVILEPIGELKVYMPDANLGDIMGDITKRRGRVLGMGAADEPKMQELVAEVPMAEMGDFSVTLRSVTAGRGYFTLEFARYEDAPMNVAQKVIEEAKKDMEE